LTYIPDAKAVTDAPESILVLIKQRRRWMNGALFAAWRVLWNSSRMIGFTGGTTHPVFRKFFMVFFMIFYFANQLFQLLIVGQFFITIKIFFQNQFAVWSGIFQNPDIENFFNG
jgi:chitin synthase